MQSYSNHQFPDNAICTENQYTNKSYVDEVHSDGEHMNGDDNGNGHKDSTRHDCDVTGMPDSDRTGKNYKMRDTRDRPTEQLIKELNIKSPIQAGWLRANKQISYIEWKRVKDYVSQQEIESGGAGLYNIYQE